MIYSLLPNEYYDNNRKCRGRYPTMLVVSGWLPVRC